MTDITKKYKKFERIIKKAKLQRVIIEKLIYCEECNLLGVVISYDDTLTGKRRWAGMHI